MCEREEQSAAELLEHGLAKLSGLGVTTGEVEVRLSVSDGHVRRMVIEKTPERRTFGRDALNERERPAA